MDPDAAAAAIAARQHGIVSAAQLAAVGMSRRALAHRLSKGRLRRIHQGVYLVGAVAGPLGAEVAALLACGPRAVLSHRTALTLWGLGERPTTVEVTVPGGRHVHAGVRRYRSQIDPRDRARRYGLPLTAPARTLLDLAPSMPAVQLGRLLEEVQVQRLATRRDVEAALRRGKDRPGASALRAALDRDQEPALTRSEAERRLRELIRAARLPPPVSNVRIGRHEVDLLWPEHRLIVEVDGFRYHSSRAAFERDRRKDAELQALGYRVVRITWRRIVEEPESVIAQLAVLLAPAAFSAATRA